LLYDASDMIKQVDAAYSLHEIPSRSEFVCKAVEFYLGYLQTENSTELSKTTLASSKTTCQAGSASMPSAFPDVRLNSHDSKRLRQPDKRHDR
jgi:hypothetical protein